MWNRLDKIGQAVAAVLSPDEDEERRRRMDPASLIQQQGGGSTAVDNAMPNTPAANPSLRRMASPAGGYGGNAPMAGQIKAPPSSDIGPGAVMAPAEDPQSSGNNPNYTPAEIIGGAGEDRNDQSNGKWQPVQPATMAAAAPLTRYEKDQQALNHALDNRDTEVSDKTTRAKQRSGFSRFWRGLGHAWETWDGKGGLGGLVGDMLEGGFGEGTSPKKRAERQVNENLGKMWNRVGQDAALDEMGQKRQQSAYKTAEGEAELQGKILDTGLKVPKFQQDQLENEQKVLIKTAYDVSDEFDPSAPENAGIVARMKAAGVPVVHKKKGEKYQHVVLPNGDLKIFDPSTGKTVDAGNYAKPPSISKTDLPDTLFGLSDDKEIADQAASSVKNVKADRSLRPEAAAALINATNTDEAGNVTHPYQNEDGSVNEQKYWDDMVNGDAMLKPGDVYQNDVSGYAQKLASARTQLRSGQKSRRVEADRFRTAITNHTPSANAQSVPITTVVKDFNRVLDIKDPKKRKMAIDAYYTHILPNIKVGG